MIPGNIEMQSATLADMAAKEDADRDAQIAEDMEEGVLLRVRYTEQAIIKAEGPYHVEGTYYANPEDAARQRRWYAERIIRENDRWAAWDAQHTQQPVLFHVA